MAPWVSCGLFVNHHVIDSKALVGLRYCLLTCRLIHVGLHRHGVLMQSLRINNATAMTRFTTGNRNAASLEALLRHLLRRVADPRHARQLAAVAHRLLDIYGGVVRCLKISVIRSSETHYLSFWLAGWRRLRSAEHLLGALRCVCMSLNLSASWQLGSCSRTPQAGVFWH